MSTPKVSCPHCDGDGEEPGAPQRPDEKVLCSECGGKGVLPRRKAILILARQQHQDDGKVEIDSNAKLSEGDDNGTYVQAWVWVDFADQPGLDKE